MAQRSLFHEQDERERREEAERERLKREQTPPVEFLLTLFDETPVTVTFTLYSLIYSSHLEFRGDISSTGYWSHFTGAVLEGWTEPEVKELALKIANACRKELLEERRREERKAEKKKRVPAAGNRSHKRKAAMTTEEIFAKHGYLETPRGLFKYGFLSVREAREAGFHLHHQHEDGNGFIRYVVTRDNHAYAALGA